MNIKCVIFREYDQFPVDYYGILFDFFYVTLSGKGKENLWQKLSINLPFNTLILRREKKLSDCYGLLIRDSRFWGKNCSKERLEDSQILSLLLSTAKIIWSRTVCEALSWIISGQKILNLSGILSGYAA